MDGGVPRGAQVRGRSHAEVVALGAEGALEHRPVTTADLLQARRHLRLPLPRTYHA